MTLRIHVRYFLYHSFLILKKLWNRQCVRRCEALRRGRSESLLISGAMSYSRLAVDNVLRADRLCVPSNPEDYTNIRESDDETILSSSSPSLPPIDGARRELVEGPAPSYRAHFNVFFSSALSQESAGVASPLPTSVYLNARNQLAQLCVPLRRHLSELTVTDLIREFTRRASQRYPTLLSKNEVEAFLMRRPAAETDALDLPSLREAIVQRSEELTARNVFPSVSLRKARFGATEGHPSTDEAHFTLIDARMNAEDSLDCFFAVPYSAQNCCEYDVVVKWGTPRAAAAPGSDGIANSAEGLAPRETLTAERGRSTQPLTNHNGGQLNCSPVACQRLQPLPSFSGTASPVFPLVQRSTYVDLLLRKQKQRSRAVAPIQGLPEEEERLDSSASSFGSVEEVVVTEHKQRLYDARLALCREELTSRHDITDAEATDRGVIDDLGGDSLRHVLTLEALRGDFTQNGKLASLLRQYHCYPFDTIPLADHPSEAYKKKLQGAGNVTAALSFAYADDDWVTATEERTKKEQYAAQMGMSVEEVDRIRADLLESFPLDGPDDGCPHLVRLLDATERSRQKAEEELNRMAYYESRGEPVPPRTPSPSLPPRTPRIEDLPDQDYDANLAEYTDGRREIVTIERIAFRTMIRLVREVLEKQRAMDAAAVQAAYREELTAARDVFDMGAYVPYNEKMLLTSSLQPLPGMPELLAVPGMSGALRASAHKETDTSLRMEDDCVEAIAVGSAGFRDVDESKAEDDRARTLHTLQQILHHASLPLHACIAQQAIVKKEQEVRENISVAQSFEWGVLALRTREV